MQSTFTKKALLACIACGLSSAVCGGAGRPALPDADSGGTRSCVSAFTNHAGHVVSGQLTALTNGTAVINGRAYPLSIFPDSEQARMRALLRVPQKLPPGLEERRCSLRERMLRSEALVKAGVKTPEDAVAQRERLEAVWRRTLETSSLDPVTRAHWLGRLVD